MVWGCVAAVTFLRSLTAVLEVMMVPTTLVAVITFSDVYIDLWSSFGVFRGYTDTEDMRAYFCIDVRVGGQGFGSGGYDALTGPCVLRFCTVRCRGRCYGRLRIRGTLYFCTMLLQDEVGSGLSFFVMRQRSTPRISPSA